MQHYATNIKRHNRIGFVFQYVSNLPITKVSWLSPCETFSRFEVERWPPFGGSPVTRYASPQAPLHARQNAIECSLAEKKDGWSFHYWYLYQLMMGAATDVVVKPMSLLKKPQTNLAISSTAPDALFLSFFFCFFDQRSIWGLNHFALNWAFNEPKLLSRIGFMGSSVRCRRQVQNMFFVWTKYRLI